VIEFVDIAGLVHGASRGEGLGNQFLSHIREVHALAHVVRCFQDPNVVHVDGSVEPRRDIEIVETELLLKDVETVEKRLADARKRAKVGDRRAHVEMDVCERLRMHLASGRRAANVVPHGPEESAVLLELHLLTSKPVLFVCNIRDTGDDEERAFVEEVRMHAAPDDAPVVVVNAALEAEVCELPPGERRAFLEELGVRESGLEHMIQGGYRLLRLITFFTANAREAHAWTVREGTPAVEAAGVIHTDFARGFIRADIIRHDDLLRLGTVHAVREHGLLRSEGKDYVMQDGDIMEVRFHL
jgi:hypothetical protein